jgi:hypothetical protein
MKKSVRFFGLAFCVLSITLTGRALAASSAEALESRQEWADSFADNTASEKECQLFYVTGGGNGLREASMQAGEAIDNAIHLFISDRDGKIIKDAQVITTIIDAHGNQRSGRALPTKGGYLIAVDQLAAGQYRVETEIVTIGQILTDEFIFNKA